MLTLVAIHNASREQRLLDQLYNTNKLLEHSTLAPESLESFSHFKVISLNTSLPAIINFNDCEITITRELIDNPVNSFGGAIYNSSCSMIWNRYTPQNSDYAYLILQAFDITSFDNILKAYRNRMIIPLIFFVWITVWGSLMLGNLVQRLQTQKNEVEHIALHDALTQLPNRIYFSEKVNEQISYCRRHQSSFTLSVIDLNKFKQVNDELGHQYGDAILTQVAARLKDTIREYDVAARLGGDEFILLLVNSDSHSSSQLLERIYHRLIEPYIIFDKTLTIGASIGVAVFPSHASDYKHLFHNADLAMYQAKNLGGGIKLYQNS